MARRVRIEMTFEVDLDQVPGFGHETSSWVEYVVYRLEQGINHYHPTLKIRNVTTREDE